MRLGLALLVWLLVLPALRERGAARPDDVRGRAGRAPVLGPRQDVGRRPARHDGDAAARGRARPAARRRHPRLRQLQARVPRPGVGGLHRQRVRVGEARLRGAHVHRARAVGLVRHARRAGRRSARRARAAGSTSPTRATRCATRRSSSGGSSTRASPTRARIGVDRRLVRRRAVVRARGAARPRHARPTARSCRGARRAGRRCGSRPPRR